MTTKRMLENQIVLIVGGSSGIGRAVAELAGKNGAHVVIASRHARENSDCWAQASDAAIETHAFDITSSEDCIELFKSVGPIDHLVITVRPDLTPSPFLQTEICQAKTVFDTKLWGPYRLIQVAQRHIREHGSIILTSGIAGEKIYKGASTMALVNGAVETLGRVLAVELAPLRVNVVSPGFVEPKPKEIQTYADHFPAGRVASVHEVAMAYLSLMTNAYITGTITVIDGGARLI